MRIRCPHCHSLVELTAETEAAQILCPSCQRSFSVSVEDTVDHAGPALPASHITQRKSIGRFQLLERVAVGAFSDVWQARDAELDRIVALKLCRGIEKDDRRLKQFKREARAVAKLKHPNIVAVYEVGIEDGQLYIVQEYVEGTQLNTWRQNKKPSLKESATICSQVARALAHAHDRHVVHRDLKPSNIIVDADNMPHIVDFGLAEWADQDSFAVTGTLLGTPAYMSPEQIQGKEQGLDQQTDVYALGTVLYELLTGQRPFPARNIQTLFHQVIHEPPPAPSRINPMIQRGLELICLKCIEKVPEQRYASADDLADDLDRFVADDILLLGTPLDADSELQHLKSLIESLRQQVAERSQMLLAVKAEHDLYRSLIESLPLCVFRKNREGQFVFANDFFCEKFGEATGRSASDLFPEHLVEEQQKADRQVISSGRVLRSVEEHERNGDSTFFDVIRSPVHDLGGRVNGLQGLMWDVSAHTKAEKAMREAKEAAEAANQAKSEFLANISHEIRTPMNGIMGLTSILLQKDKDEEVHRYLHMVHESAESLLRIIDDVLDFSKLEANRLQLLVADFHIRELVEGVAALFSASTIEKDVEVRSQIAMDVPQQVTGDAPRIRQVLVNLVANAVKFTEMGQVAIELTREDPDNYNDATADGEATPAENQNNVRLRFAVRDTGVGIPKEKRQVIFDAFEQADSSITRKYGGTGLGLAISSQLVALMGGEINVESKVGEGSVFHFAIELPIAQPSEPSTAEPHEAEFLPAEAETRPLHILLVEDHPVNQEFAVRALKDGGHEVTVANNGQEALDVLDRRAFDVILMDLQMPVMDGLTATARIRERETVTGGHVPIIAMTAHAMSDHREQCLAVGMDGFLSKPVRIPELMMQLSALGEGRHRCGSTEATVVKPSTIHETFDQEKLLQRVGGDHEFLRRVVDMFKEDYANLRRDVQGALDNRDSQAFVTLVHKLKGVIKNFDATTAAEAAAALESIARRDGWHAAEKPWNELQEEVKKLHDDLDEFVDT